MLPSDVEVKSLQNHGKTGIPVSARVFGLGFLDCLVLLGAQMKPSLVLVAQGRSRRGEEFKGHSAGNQRQDAKGDIYHACELASAMPLAKPPNFPPL